MSTNRTGVPWKRVVARTLPFKNRRSQINHDKRYGKRIYGIGTSWPVTWVSGLLYATEKNYMNNKAKLHRITLSYTQKGWRAVVAVLWKEKEYVAFLTTSSLKDTLFLLGEGLLNKSLKFRLSKYQRN